ncbi:general transcription factor II-I repeat domain-containing protein 2-like [Stegodyphus dumicola]|uniref:general transcription factor II-I repeat domain-containing protein 2-like n=1 Tax=Stegodyphus dumicola TaxID=202533 RepID=UPI0015B2C67D|nr:general transcription factor II-I repeat domain-containing protein 2-like [Stegodyphus dumicola]
MSAEDVEELVLEKTMDEDNLIRLLEGSRKMEEDNLIPISRHTTKRRITAINTSLEYNLKNDLKDCIAFSLALGELTDITDILQLAVFIRFVSPDPVVTEELLDLVEFEESTHGFNIKNALDSIMKTFDVPLNKLVCTATNGAAAMLG